MGERGTKRVKRGGENNTEDTKEEKQSRKEVEGKI